MSKGYLALVLHAHLPYVRHPEDSTVLEERWLYEALTETYIPLLHMLERLTQDQVPYRLTISFSPPLMGMLTDSLLQQRYQKHLEKSLELAEREIARTKNEPHFQVLARMYQRLLQEALATFNRYNRNILQGYKQIAAHGNLEVITCAATHGYFPLLGIQEEILRVQTKLAVRAYEKHFGKKPLGMWLPECGYFPGVDRILKEEDIQYFFVDTHGLLFATPRPRYGTYMPIRCPAGVAAFGRDVESSVQVWSAQEGYPGDYDYREFYRDIGYDLDYEYIKDYIHPSGLRIDTGFKYYRITGKGDWKEPYNPERARYKALEHAGNFLFNRIKQLEYLTAHMEHDPIVVSPYDAELFGHWWFEGPLWLEFLLRKAATEQNIIELTTPSAYLERHPVLQQATPCASSWGNNGYNEVWLDGSNDWIYRHLHQAGKRMLQLAQKFKNPSPLERRALNQAARELLLAQSSDWAFIMKTGTMVEYAKRRIIQHIGRFNKLYEEVLKGQLDVSWLTKIEALNNFFPDLDYSIFCPENQTHKEAVFF